jgi:tetratricopeptide (TPR) repeat protein
MRGALARSGHPDAESRAGEITAALDGFAQRWTELDAAACATGTIAARRCLERRREHVAAIVHGVGQLPITARAVDRLRRTLPELLGLDECGRIPSDGPQGAVESPARAAVAARVHSAHTRELLIGHAEALPDYEALLGDPELSAFPDLAAENLRRATSARLALGRIDLGAATAAFERAEATAAAGDDPAVASRVLVDRANAAGAAGDPSEARRLLRFSASQLARAGNPALESIRVAILEAELAVFLDSPEAALTQATAARDTALTIGYDALAERAQLVVARAALEQGQPARAAAILEELHRTTLAALGDHGHALVEIELSLGQALISAARPSAAREIYERVAGRLAASQPDSDNLAFALAGLAAARAQGGDLDGAAEAARRAVTIYRIHGDAMGEAMVEITAAEIAHRDGRRSDALAALARGRAIYEAHLGVDHPNLAQIRELAVEFAAAP